MHVLTTLTRIAIGTVAAVAVACPVTVAAATTTICVGLVVDARPLGGPVSTGCTTVADGSTGYDVLRAAGHTVGFRRDGLVCTIDNRPADGCAATDADHFWAYFHRPRGSTAWQYSNEGSTTYKPDNGETEGWVWRDGDSAKPENVPYRTICPQASSPSATPSPHRTSSAAATATPAPPATASTTPAATTTQRSRSHAGRRQHHVVVSMTVAPTPARTSTTAATPSTRPSTAISSTGDADSSGPPYGLMAGAVAVVGLGGVAAARWRRREVD